MNMKQIGKAVEFLPLTRATSVEMKGDARKRLLDQAEQMVLRDLATLSEMDGKRKAECMGEILRDLYRLVVETEESERGEFYYAHFLAACTALDTHFTYNALQLHATKYGTPAEVLDDTMGFLINGVFVDTWNEAIDAGKDPNAEVTYKFLTSVISDNID